MPTWVESVNNTSASGLAVCCSAYLSLSPASAPKVQSTFAGFLTLLPLRCYAGVKAQPVWSTIKSTTSVLSMMKPINDNINHCFFDVMLSYISLLQQHPTSSSCRTALPEQFDVTFEALPGSIQHKSPHRHNSAKLATACACTRRIESPAELAQQLLCTGKAPVEQARSSLDTANHNRRWQLLPHRDLSSHRLHLETP